MNLKTQYLGLELAHPILPGASPLSRELDSVKQLEDANAPAIILSSLFEEQLTGEQLATHHSMEDPAESFAEALSYLPVREDFALGPEEYLQHLRRVKEAVSIPVVGSLNGTTAGGWTGYAKLIAEAGADALELNVYEVETDPSKSGAEIETATLELIASVIGQVDIPVAVKLSPFYTSVANFVGQIERTGAAGVVLFNRFYEPDIDPEALEVENRLRLSSSSELLLRLNWISIVSPSVELSISVSGGVHTGRDVVKSIMAGADTTQMVSSLLQKGPGQLSSVHDELVRWMEEHEYESLSQMRGSMNLERCPDPKAFERTNYMRILQSWKEFV